MEKKITLYNPKSGDLRDYHGAPLSLIAIARFLYYEGYKINIFQHFEKDAIQNILESCKESVCLGFTCMTGHQIKDCLRIAKIVRKRYPKLPIIWGGWHPSILPDQTLENKYVDVVVRSQGEITFTEIAHRLYEKRSEKNPLESLKEVTGLSYKIKGRRIHNPDRPFEDINNFPEMPYELVDVEKTLLNSEFGKRTINYYASQGCPFRCDFCADPQVYKRRWSILAPDRIVKELKKLKNDYDIDSVIFADSNFFVNEKHTKEFCKKWIKTGIKLKLGQVDGRSNVLAKYDESTWRLMKKAGFVNILNGTESGSQEILDFIHKDASVEDTIKLAKLCNKYDITLVCSTFIGLPTKNIDEEFRINIDFIDKLMKISAENTYYLLIYTPYPGSPTYNLCLEQGFKPPKTLEQWAEFELHKVTTSWVSKRYVELGEQLSLYYFPLLGNQLKQVVNHYNPVLRTIVTPLYYLVRGIVKLRWKLKFFAMPVDYYLFRYMLFIKDRFSRNNSRIS
jgi:radical SAM superfamily enzyme YgiQ (UPF0313 family)